jgi:hypothetical protein
MKNLLAKLLSIFKKPELKKTTEPWPFPPPLEEEKAPVKKSISVKPRKVAVKRVAAAAKKTVVKKKVE